MFAYYGARSRERRDCSSDALTPHRSALDFSFINSELETHMSKARIAIIGTGSWSTTAHFPALAAHPDAEIAAICDHREDALKLAADAFGIANTYTDYREMLDQVELDGAVVAFLDRP